MPDAIQEAFSKKERDSEAMKAFGYRLKNQFSINEAYRRPKELEWLESLRQYKGLYDPEVKLDPMASKVYPKITRSKVNIVLSRLHEMLFPETDRNWEILPTPEPTLTKEVVKGIAMSLVKKDQTGQTVLPTMQELQLGIKKYADDACAAMASVIEDQLLEMDYSEETKKVLRSGLMFGTGIMKGPMINKRVKRKWEPAAGGDYQEAKKDEDVPFFEAVRIWDWYPDMSVTELDKMEGSFQRHLMTKHDIRKLLKRTDFYSDMIEAYLVDHPNGDYTPKAWEVDLQVIEVEAGTGKLGRTTTSVTAGTTDDDRRSTNRQLGKKYQVLEYWGYVDGSDLERCGLNIDDVTLEYAANIWLLDNVPVKATLYDGALNKYKLFYYEKDETSLFGEGLCRIMRHSQIAIAASARMVLDNAACVAGPQVEVNWDLLTPGTDFSSFYPRKIWFRGGRGIDSQYPAIRGLEFNSHIDELLKIIEAFKQFGDEETTLPTWMISQMVNNETAQATSGRMATITISIKDVVKNFDTFTEEIMEDLYAWNMEFNDRPDIKGDFKVNARGVSSLVMKEIRMQALNQLATTMTPEDWVYVDRREFLNERFKTHDVNMRLRSEAEADQERQKADESKAQQLMYAQAEADIAYKKAQTMGQLTKAKDHNIEAELKAQAPPAPGEDPRLRDAELAKNQAELDATQQDSALAREKHGMDVANTAQDMEHKRITTAMDIAQQHDQHKMDMASKVADMGMKKEAADHSMMIKEKVAVMRAKNKPKPAKK